MNRLTPVVRFALAGLSGVLLILSFQPFAFWPLAWIALCPLFIAALDSPEPGGAATLGAFAGLVFYTVSLHWMVNLVGPVAAGFWCAFALWTALNSVLMWKIWNVKRSFGSGRFKEFLFVAAAGVLWTGIEYARAEAWWHECPWMVLGYSQTPGLAMLQTAGLIGVYGLSALIVSFNAALCLLIRERRAAAAGSMGLVLLLLFSWGRHRVATLPAESGPRLSVALVQDASMNLDALAAFSLAPEAAKADLLAWPEYSMLVRNGEEEKALNLLNKKLKGSRAVKMIGIGTFPEKDRPETVMMNYNWFISPEGRTLGRYDKLHPVPYVEKGLLPTRKNLGSNPDPSPVDTPLGRLGSQICYDLDFEDTSRILASKGARLLVANSGDPLEWGRWEHLQHSAMSPARAVETGLWLVRSASAGSSQIIDPLGRIRAWLPTGQPGLLTGPAHLSEPGTFYSRFGWLFSRFCLLATALTLLFYLPEFWKWAKSRFGRRRAYWRA